MERAQVDNRENKRQLSFWDRYYCDVESADPVDYAESSEAIQARKKRLEAEPESWFKHYFDKYCTAEPAPFHKRSTRRVLNNPEWYEVRPWARSLAKTGRTMLEALYLSLTGKKKMWLVVSATNNAAVNLLNPFKLAFERNKRIIHDYGEQQGDSMWREDMLLTRSGAMFIALGAGNTPRGIRNEELRPDAIIVDDFDTDEDCRNPDIVDKKWDWFERAVYATRDIPKPLLVIFNGNIIAEYCCIKKAMALAGGCEVVNIRDKRGKSTWPAKNSEADIDKALSKISAAAAQNEYFNNPIVLGKVFKALNYGKTRPLGQYKFLVAYTDPSYKKNADFKATALVGRYKSEYHVLQVYCDRTTTAAMLDWQFQILEYVAGKTAVYFYIEWPWIDEMLKVEIEKASKRHGQTLALRADDRKKPDKFYRIESTLEPLNRDGKLIFNQRLKDTPHMKAMAFQFLALSPKSRAHDDGPDAVEGSIWRVNKKFKQSVVPPRVWAPPVNDKRF